MKTMIEAGVLGILFSVAGCASDLPMSVEEVETKHLAFLRDGDSTREDILLRLGDPTGVFEDGRILTFRIEATETGVTSVRREYDRDYRGVTKWHVANLSVVTVFDGKNVLRRHALVPVRP